MGTPVTEQSPAANPPQRKARPDRFPDAKDRLTFLERLNIAFIRRTFEIRWLNRFLLWCQRYPGAFWVHHCTKHIRHVYGIERIPDIAAQKSVIVVSNHRSFFDMYVINMVLYRHGFLQRLLFPVRSTFFYDHPLGFFVNGIMSWFSMYPPIFRDRKRLSLNHTAFSELSRALQLDGRSAGIHPEGTRNKGDDPYELLPAQSGVGRLIHLANVEVLPVFINGLGNDLYRQIKGNFDKKGDKVVVVFGEPIDFGDLLDAPQTGKTHRAIAERTLEVIKALGEEEKVRRAELLRTGDGGS